MIEVFKNVLNIMWEVCLVKWLRFLIGWFIIGILRLYVFNFVIKVYFVWYYKNYGNFI